jgi:hypothetical protein
MDHSFAPLELFTSDLINPIKVFSLKGFGREALNSVLLMPSSPKPLIAIKGMSALSDSLIP